jgi:hypothetical protein
MMELDAVFDILPRMLTIGCKISQQDGEWWLWESGGDGVVGGSTFREMCERLLSVDVAKYERDYDERCRAYMERSRGIDIFGW